MKTKNLFLLLCLSLISSVTFAQTKEHPQSIRISGGVQDSYGPYENQNNPFGIWNTENLDKAFQLQYASWQNEFIDYGVNVTATNADNLYDNDFDITGGQYIDNGSVLDLDLFARYKFYNGEDIKEAAFIKPYVYTGVSGTYISALDTKRNVDNGLGANVPLGIGFKFNTGQKVHLDLSGAFRVGLFDKIPNRWEYQAGLAFNFGTPKVQEVEEIIVIPEPVDTDGDGIIDVEDDCPRVKGLAKFDGCPDTDGDGIQDKLDECPETPGVVELNGCPRPVDTDGDGIADKDDDCPTVPGIVELNGCPDTDGDGIADKDDRCPSVPGVASQQGCPEKVTQPVVDQLKDISENIFFELESFALKPESKNKLDELIRIINDYANFNLSIEGHTDSSGRAAYNQTLSEKRAAAVRDYLVSRGIPSNRVSSVGYGENRPISDNSTAQGRAMNRRVELHLKR